MMRSRLAGIPPEMIVRSQLYPTSQVPAGIPIEPCDKTLASIWAYVVTDESGKERLEVHHQPAKFEGNKVHQITRHEDVHRRGLNWRNAVVFSREDIAANQVGSQLILDSLKSEYIVAMHTIGTRKAWQGVSLHHILEGLEMMKHAIAEQVYATGVLPEFMSPMTLIREAKWGRLLEPGNGQPKIGRWHPAGGLIYSDNGFAWKALAPLTECI